MSEVNNQKEKKPVFDSEHGFESMKNWNPILRWILVLPVAIITAVLANGLSDWALKISSAQWFLYTSGTIFNTLSVALFIYYGAATAPKARKMVMIVLVFIQAIFKIVVLFIPQEMNPNFDLSITNKVLTIIAFILGTLMAFWWSKNKPKE